MKLCSSSLWTADEDSSVDAENADSDTPGKGKAKLEEAVEGVKPLRVFMGSLVSTKRRYSYSALLISLFIGCIWPSSSVDLQVRRERQEILWEHVDGERNEFVDGRSDFSMSTTLRIPRRY